MQQAQNNNVAGDISLLNDEVKFTFIDDVMMVEEVVYVPQKEQQRAA